MLLPEGGINRKDFFLKLVEFYDLQIAKFSLFHSYTVIGKFFFEEIMLYFEGRYIVWIIGNIIHI